MAINLNNSFYLEMTPDQAWALLNDLERIAPCVPGARLTEIDGNDYQGTVKVKLGPITAEYKGVATITKRDDTTRTLTVTGKGRDVRGQGTAGADMVASITPENTGSRVNIDTDVALSGKVAQLGRGLMQDVSARLIDQFVVNLGKLEAQSPAMAAPASDETPDVPAPDSSAPDMPGVAMPASEPVITGPRKINSPPAEAVDLMKVSSASLFPRDLMVGMWMGAVLILLLVIAFK